jgi:integrase
MSRRSGQCGSIEKKGGFYVVRFWLDVPGQELRVHKSVRICPVKGQGTMTKPERERRAREIIAESGADSEQHFRKVEAVNLGTTFRQQAEWWIKNVQDRKRKPVKAHTVTSWKSHLVWINPVIGDMPLADVGNRTMRDLVARMTDEGYAAKSIRNFSQVVKMVTASAICDDGEEMYPRKWNAEFIDFPDVTGQHTPVFKGNAVEQIVSKAEGKMRILYALLAATGLRIGEALALEVSHFDRDARTLSIVQGVWNGKLQTPKTRAGVREVDLAPEIAAMLSEYLRDRKTGFIFRSASGGTLGQSNILRRDLHPLLAKLEHEKCGFHAFRRFRVTHLRKQNAPEDLLRFWIGHGDKTITDRYALLKRDLAFRRTVCENVGIGFSIEVVPLCPPTSENQPRPQVIHN